MKIVQEDSVEMKFSWVPYAPQIGKLLKIILPKDMTVPILQGGLRGKKWIICSSNIECALGSFEYEKRVLFEKMVMKSSVVYDIGAHVGFYTLLASELVGEGGKVIAFEPVPQNLKYLKKHLEINHCDNVMVIETAVSDKDGVSHFNDEPNSSMGHLSEDGNLIVNTVSIDELVGNGKIPAPDYIKIDVEGAELLVLKGAKSTLNYSPKIFLATHSPKIHIDCCNFLASFDYNLKPIVGNDLYATTEIFAYKDNNCTYLEARKKKGGTNKKYKVAIIHNIISPYRVPLFEGLANHPALYLFVYFCAKIHKERKWDILESDKYNYEVLPGVSIEFLGNHINPSIISKLIKERYDVVITGGCTYFTAQAVFVSCKLLKIPVILWTEGIESAQSLLGKAIRPLTKHITKNVDAVIVPGTKSRDFQIEMGASKGKIFIAPNIVDNKMFMQKSSKFKKEKERFKQELNIPNEKIILFVGRLVKGKGVEYLIRAYKKLKDEFDDCCLVIIGDGILKKELKEICIKEEIKDVHFTGWLSEERIIYYSIADLFVLPTLEDVWGLVINEAMCCGLPVISTKAAGCAADMIIPGENGFVVDEANVDQLYLAMKKIILNDELSRRMSEKSSEIIEKRYNIAQAVNGFVSAIEYACRVRK